MTKEDEEQDFDDDDAEDLPSNELERAFAQSSSWPQRKLKEKLVSALHTFSFSIAAGFCLRLMMQQPGASEYMALEGTCNQLRKCVQHLPNNELVSVVRLTYRVFEDLVWNHMDGGIDATKSRTTTMR